MNEDTGRLAGADGWKRRLDVWAWAAFRAIERLSDDELAQLKTDCDQASRTNCWWAAYNAAQGLLPFVHSEMETRQRAQPSGGDQQ